MAATDRAFRALAREEPASLVALDLLKIGEEFGVEKGFERGLEQGLEQGAVREARRSVERVLSRRGLTVSEAQRAVLVACVDLPTLERWLDQAVTAASADEALR